MSESHATDSSEQSSAISHQPVSSSDSPVLKESPDLLLSLESHKPPRTLISSLHEPKSSHAPCWLQPFFSLRVQLTCIYSLLSLLMVVVSILLTQCQSTILAVLGIVGGIVAVGTALTWGVTTVLLRPLWRVTDAAQAIAIGDLEQRGRLPLRLPPQDEIDRLAGSLNEMVMKLEYAQKMQHASEARFRRFFSDASHQLRTPLTSIRGFTELLMRGAKDDTEMAKHILVRMKSENERMTRLVNDLLTIARLDDQHPLKLQYLDLIELAIESIEQTRTHANDDHQISLDIGLNTRLGVQADHERIKQLLFILLDNAVKHGCTDAKGKVTLKLDKQDEQVVIVVKDNGEGIAPEDLGHIFDAFYRGRHRTTTTSSVGAGLGLTIASTIVRAHNGTISVCSSAEQGTEFKVTLPSAG